jgi:MraZ protein
METILSGEFESTVDPKGRFLMPALLKKQLPQNELEDLWLNRSIHGLKCLVLFPGTVWKEELNRIYSRNRFDRRVEELGRLFQAGSTSISFDSNARVLIPKRLLDHAGISKDIILKAAFDRIEIWDRETYESYITQLPYDIGDLVKQVMVDDDK